MASSSDGSQSPLLEVRGLSLSFGGVAALAGVDFAITPGSLHGIVGPNGAGKTTCFNCITRMQQPDSGDIRLAGQSILRVSRFAMAGLGVTRTFQHPQVCPTLTVLENVLLGYHSRYESSLLLALVRARRARLEEVSALERARELLLLLGLSDMAARPADSLPYAVLKRLEIARALMPGPRLLLLDEPAAGLTSTDVDHLSEILLRLNQELGISILLIEHHLGLVGRVTDRVTVLANGATLAEGTLAEVADRHDVREAFLGKERA